MNSKLTQAIHHVDSALRRLHNADTKRWIVPTISDAIRTDLTATRDLITSAMPISDEELSAIETMVARASEQLDAIHRALETTRLEAMPHHQLETMRERVNTARNAAGGVLVLLKQATTTS